MSTRFSLGVAACLVSTGAFADSLSHSGQSVRHSGKAASHGSAALGSAVASVVAVPLVLGGGSLEVTGAALQSVGDGALRAGTEVLERTLPQAKPQGHMQVRAHRAPRLD